MGKKKLVQLVCGHKDEHPALSRYGHGDICSECGTREATEGDFIGQVSAPKPPETSVPVIVQEEKMSVEKMITLAIQEKVPVETMERILAMRRELKAEWAKGEYDKNMATFQAECPEIKKTKVVKTNDGREAYRYAPIESVVSQVKSLLQKYGFSYTTGMELKEGGVKVVVRVTHSAGHSEETSMEVPFGNKTNVMSQSQVAAAAQTFAKRYAFLNAFGILTGDEDNDARPVEEAKDAPRQPLQGPMSDAQFGMINVLVSKKGVDREKVKEFYKVESLKDLTKEQAHHLIDQLQKKADAPVEGEAVIEH